MGGVETELRGRRILITRPAGRARALIATLEARGARADARPTIDFERSGDRRPIERALRDLGRYDWLLLTSPTGVRFFFEERARLGGGPTMPRAIAVVGPGTARALQAHGWEADRVASDSRAEGLARALEGRLAPGQRVLWVRPERARPLLADRLEDLGAKVDAVSFYRTVAAEGIERLRGDVAAGAYDAAVFSSPSTLLMLVGGANGVAGRLARALRRMRRVAIGEVTAAALVEAGWPADAIADEPTDAGIVRALERAFGN